MTIGRMVSSLALAAAVSATACGGAGVDDSSAANTVEGAKAECPALAGSYECPAWGSQPAYDLKVTERGTNPGKEYTFTYSYLGDEPALSVLATREGVAQAGFVGQCVRYEERDALVLYPEGADPATKGTYSFRTAEGSYRADFGGVTQIVCVPVAR